MVDCPLCVTEKSISKHIYDYKFWKLFLHADKKREKIRIAAGFLASMQHAESPEQLTQEGWLELQAIYHDAAIKLCDASGSVFTGDMTVGFNQGEKAGQTVDHAHVHIFPVSEEDPKQLNIRGGMSGAFEALRKERLDDE